MLDGRVLIVGRYYEGIATAQAELYDPKTNVWTLTGSMNYARAEHTASILPNGKVLVAGGDNSTTESMNSAELYDPLTGNWSITGKMHNTRMCHTATVLLNGKVLVNGGDDYYSTSGLTLATAELYDPLTGNWSKTGDMSFGRERHDSSLLINGLVLVTGGMNPDDHETEIAQLYNTTTGTWAITYYMLNNRHYHTASVLSNGKVLVVGGLDEYDETINSTELYDPTISDDSNTSKTFVTIEQHKAPMSSMAYNSSKEAVISSDEKKNQKKLRKRIIPIKKH